MRRTRTKTIVAIGAVALLGMFALAQAVPYGRAHSNPGVVAEPAWDAPATRVLAERACFDCHSNQTRWPWYSHVAPMSWLVQNHVDEGRAVLNFSEWNRAQHEAGEAGESVREGEMPPRSYVLLHPEARLGPTERDLLSRGLDASLGTSAHDD
ncbi:MAG TPA: heme-binding domain-containing protein [Kofleriaceae bacterium]|nr:heme-binding domain-containing protein [Kofleriaceae bacterium]